MEQRGLENFDRVGECARFSLLLAGDVDGVVRVWGGLGLEQGPYEERSVRVVSAFRAIDVVSFQKSAGLVCAWSPREAHLYCAGDAN